MTIDISAYGFGKILPPETAPVRKVVQISTMVHAEHVRRGFSPRMIRVESIKTDTVEITL
jgi:hypothetical protein